MKAGDIVLYHGKGKYSKVIEFFTKSYWSHAALVSDVNSTGPIVIEATGAGLITTQLKFKDNLDILSYRDPGLTQEQVLDGLNWARKKAAQKIKYNYVDILFIGLHLILKSWNIAIINDQYFCSEFVGEYLEHSGVDLPTDPIFMSPGDLDTLYPKVSE